MLVGAALLRTVGIGKKDRAQAWSQRGAPAGAVPLPYACEQGQAEFTAGDRAESLSKCRDSMRSLAAVERWLMGVAA